MHSYFPKGQIFSIQVLRGVAAAAIVLYHLLVMSTIDASFIVDHFYWREILSAGVPLFFVISGFIILVTTVGKGSSGALIFRQPAKSFLAKRLQRIYPVYWVVFVVALVLHYSPVTNQPALEIGFLLKSFVLFPTYDEQGDLYPFVMVGWTLFYEMYFYLTFTAMLLISGYLNANVVQCLLGITAFMAVVVVFGQIVHQQPAVLAVITNPIILYFVAGYLIGLAYLHQIQLKKNLRQIGLGVNLIILALFATKVLTNETLLYQIFTAIFPIILVGLTALKAPSAAAAKAPSLWLTLGDASYSIYLTHLYLIMLATGLWKRDIVFANMPDDLSIGILFVACLVAGVVFYRLVERPLLGCMKRR